jgi:hypothetical protein
MVDVNLLIEVITFLFFALVGKLIFSNRKSDSRTFISILIGYIFFYDYLNYNIPQLFGGQLFLFKLANEIFTALLFLKGSQQLGNEIVRKILPYVIALVIMGFGVGIYSGFNIGIIYSDFRATLLPVFLIMAILYSGILQNIELEFIATVTSLLMFANGVYGYIEYIGYSGNYETYWNYKSLLQSYTKVNSDYNDYYLIYQIERNGEIRASGFFVSALTAAYSYGFVAVYYLNDFFKTKDKSHFKNKFVAIIMVFSFVFFSYFTQVRTAFLMVFLSIFLLLAFRVSKTPKARRRLTVLLPILCIGCLYFYLASDFIYFKDDSSQGRLAQYLILIQDFSILGAGCGSYPHLFDSFYIYTLLEYGIFALFFPIIILRMTNNNNRNIDDSTYIQLITFFILCSFQHIAGSLYYFLLLLMINTKSKHNKHLI